jgi:hypothetical protein
MSVGSTMNRLAVTNAVTNGSHDNARMRRVRMPVSAETSPGMSHIVSNTESPQNTSTNACNRPNSSSRSVPAAWPVIANRP